MLRKTINLSKKDLTNGLIFIEVISLGYHEVYVNGVKVGEHVLQPAVSQLDKRSLGITYSITHLLHKGENEIMLWLGQGWGRVYGTPAVAAAVVTYKDIFRGKKFDKDIAITDDTWETSPSGYSYTGSWQPLQFGGERFDARVQPDWRPLQRGNRLYAQPALQHVEG